jgi:hypothetical protein
VIGFEPARLLGRLSIALGLDRGGLRGLARCFGKHSLGTRRLLGPGSVFGETAVRFGASRRLLRQPAGFGGLAFSLSLCGFGGLPRRFTLSRLRGFSCRLPCRFPFRRFGRLPGRTLGLDRRSARRILPGFGLRFALRDFGGDTGSFRRLPRRMGARRFDCDAGCLGARCLLGGDAGKLSARRLLGFARGTGFGCLRLDRRAASARSACSAAMRAALSNASSSRCRRSSSTRAASAAEACCAFRAASAACRSASA